MRLKAPRRVTYPKKPAERAEGAKKRFLPSSLKELSPLFHQGAQISELINLSTLPSKSGFVRHFYRDGTIFRPRTVQSCGVSRVVKTVSSRGRLSAPWLRDDFCSPRAHPCCGKTYFVTLSVVGGSARAEGTDARPSRGAVKRRSDI